MLTDNEIGNVCLAIKLERLEGWPSKLAWVSVARDVEQVTIDIEGRPILVQRLPLGDDFSYRTRVEAHKKDGWQTLEVVR